MIHKDYLMRLIRRFTQGMARIAARKAENDTPAVLVEIGDTMQELFGLQPHVLRGMPDHQIMALFRTGSEINAHKALMMADLVREQAEATERTDPEDGAAVSLYMVSARLFAEALLDSRTLRTEDHVRTVNDICTRLQDEDMPADLSARLIAFYESAGRFARAEDMLYKLQDADEKRACKAGREFYERLLDRTDEELEAGGLPRDEVKDGLEMLEAD